MNDGSVVSEDQELISWCSCLQVLDRYSMEPLQFWRFKREMVIVCGMKTSDENISCLSSSGRVRRDNDIFKMVRDPKTSQLLESSWRYLFIDIIQVRKQPRFRYSGGVAEARLA
jgi:hypothetical protein